MINHLDKKLIIGYIGKNSFLAKTFITKYKHQFIFKLINLDIRDEKKIKKWFKDNKEINIFINFAAITSVNECNKNKQKSLTVNYKAPINLLNIINNSNLINFKYFLAISSSHVFKPSRFKVKEDSEKKPQNYYGITKYNLEKFILKNKNKYYYNIGIARIFNYYNNDLQKKFFINDMINLLSNDKKIIYLNNIMTYRDFISVDDICCALYKMISLKLNGDFNICSGQKIYLPKIINYLNNKIKKKKLIFDNIKFDGIIGSNLKLKSKGWILSNKNLFSELSKCLKK